MSKYLPKFIKYILLSSEDWTGVRHLSYWDICLHFTSIDIVLHIELKLKSPTHLQKWLTIKAPPVMVIFWVFAYKRNPYCWTCQSLATAENILYRQLTEAGSVDLKLACILVSGEESEISSRWATEGTGKVETKAVPCCSWVV